MIITIIVLAWLLICTWATIIFVGVDEKWCADEWLGLAIACITSPICLLIIRPIVLTIKRIKKKKNS